MESIIDPSSRVGARALRRLEKEIVAWLTTVSPGGRPQSSVVWFLRRGGELLVYSRPEKPKLRNIEQNPQVAFTLNSDEEGNDMVTIEGRARLDMSVLPADQLPPYVEKYRKGIAGIGMTPESFAASYSVPVVISPDRVRYW